MNKILISEIKIGKDRRPIDFEWVKELSEDIKELGLINPIRLNKENVLIAGLHRIEAFKILGYTEIEYTVTETDDKIIQRMQEISENVNRKELPYYERLKELKEYKKLMEILHPEIKANSSELKSQIRRKNNTKGRVTTCHEEVVSQPDIKTLTKQIAEKTNKYVDSVRRDVQIAESLDEKELNIFKNKDVSKRDALKFVALKNKDPEKAKEVVKKIENGEIKKGEIKNIKTTEEMQIESMRKIKEDVNQEVNEYNHYIKDTTGGNKKVCILNPTIENYCNDCKYGFDTFKPMIAIVCPYCGNKNFEKRDPKWYAFKTEMN